MPYFSIKFLCEGMGVSVRPLVLGGVFEAFCCQVWPWASLSIKCHQPGLVKFAFKFVQIWLSAMEYLSSFCLKVWG